MCVSYICRSLEATESLACPQAAEPDDPQDAVVARQYKEFPDVYKQTARHWSQVYAGGKVWSPTHVRA